MANNDYQKAGEIIDTLSKNEEIHISVISVPNFRKYLCELIEKQSSNNQYTTRIEGSKLKVVRIR